MSKICNADAADYARRKAQFCNTNDTLFGTWSYTNVYTVFSYGMHYPMYIWCADQWYENEDGYSRTTSKHKTQARPTNNTIRKPTEWMVKLSERGLVRLTQERLAGANK